MYGIFGSPTMGSFRGLTLSLSTAVTLILTTHQLFAATVAPRLTWLLPKTVLDATIVYTYQDCTAGHLTVKITPALTPRVVPDLIAGQRSISTNSLETYFQDNNISILTLSDSHLLSSLGSAPSSQVTQVVSNILGGITKLVAIGLHTAVAVDQPIGGGPPPVFAACSPEGDPNSAQSIAKQIKDLKQMIQNANTALANGGDDAAQKKNTAAIQAAQNLITTLQDQISITIKTTIDPGISSVLVDPYGDVGAVVPSGNGTVDKSGLVATICPSTEQLKTWFANSAKAFDGIYPCQKEPMLEINVYLDVMHGQGTMYDSTHKDNFAQTALADDDQYRDAAHIPIYVWRGKKQERIISASHFGGPPSDAIELVSQIGAFGQFGVAQALPVTVGIFKSLTWSVTFSQSGETLSPSFSSKALATNATSFFSNAATAANSIATEQRTAASSSTEANADQTRADAIYQQQRRKGCEVNPVNCPSK